MEQNLEESPMYVSDPVLNKDGLTSFTSYSLKGTKIPETLTRRYKDFDSLRSKLLERWPGVYIPNIPHKKKVGAKEKEFVDLRIEMINRFCVKLTSIDYLFKADETEIFLQNVNDVTKSLNSMAPQNYEDLLKKYSLTFSNYDDNFDTQQGKANQARFLQIIKAAYPRIRAFRDLVKASKDNFKQTQDTNTMIINMFSLYEKETMKDYCGNDEEKLVFFNMKNMDLCQSISKVQENVLNPYDKLYDSITEDMLDTEAMIEACTSLNGLQDQLDKVTKNLNTTTAQLTELQAGKSNFKSVFSFKSKEQTINALQTEKEQLEKDMENLTQIIKIATFNMENEMNSFKVKSLEVYYDELDKLEAVYNQNNKLYDDLWDTVIRDKNIMNCQ